MLNIPVDSAAQRFVSRNRITVAELIFDLMAIHKLVMRRDFETDTARRICNGGGEADQFESVVHFVCDNFDDLPDGILNVITTVVDLACRGLRLVNRKEYGVCQIPGVAVRHKTKPAFRKNHERPFIEYAAN